MSGWEPDGHLEDEHGGLHPAFVTPRTDTDEPRQVWMMRKGQRCKFITRDGEQVGPIHANVVPAVIWAFAQGWVNPLDANSSLACIREVREGSRNFDDRDPDAGAWRPHQLEEAST